MTKTKLRTSTVTVTSSVPTTTTTTSTVPATQFYTSYSIAVPQTTIVVKRSAVTTCPAPSSATPTIPAYASACTNGVAFVSACSCVGFTTARTKTLAACTAILHTTVTSYTTTTATATTAAPTSTTVEDVTTTVATRTTERIVPGSSTTTAYSFLPPCSTVHSPAAAFTAYYSGAGYSENVRNPGNDHSPDPPITQALSGDLTPCQAADACAKAAYAQPDLYYSFDLHFLASTGDWQCVQYIDTNVGGAAYFNVANPDVLQAYGYNIFSG